MCFETQKKPGLNVPEHSGIQNAVEMSHQEHNNAGDIMSSQLISESHNISSRMQDIIAHDSKGMLN